MNCRTLSAWHLCAGRAARSSQNRRKLCGLGRTVLNVRLYTSGPSKKSAFIARCLVICSLDVYSRSEARSHVRIFPVWIQEDPWNSIAAGALTGGFLQLRTGLRSSAKSAAFGGALLVLPLCMRSVLKLHCGFSLCSGLWFDLYLRELVVKVVGGGNTRACLAVHTSTR